jgi:hypothetical protein
MPFRTSRLQPAILSAEAAGPVRGPDAALDSRSLHSRLQQGARSVAVLPALGPGVSQGGFERRCL